jgi:hypothetical protein
MDRCFEQAMVDEVIEVHWSRVAVVAINRLGAPGSELAIEERWSPSTTLDDLLEIEEKTNDTRLYRRLDRILAHKTKLEQHLKQLYGEFGAPGDPSCGSQKRYPTQGSVTIYFGLAGSSSTFWRNVLTKERR